MSTTKNGVYTEYVNLGGEDAVVFRGRHIISDIPVILVHGVGLEFEGKWYLDDHRRNTADRIVNGTRFGGPLAVGSVLGHPQCWGQPVVLDAIDAQIEAMHTRYGTRTDKVAFMGTSGGGFGSLHWGWLNPDRVAHIALIIPGLNMTAIHDQNLFGFAAMIEAAFGGSNASWLAARPDVDPQLNHDLIRPFGDRIGIWAGQTDPLCTIEDARIFAAGTGAKLVELPGIGHNGGDNWDVQPVADWLVPRILYKS